MNIDKVTGCLAGAALGDAMGAATELRTIDQIKKDFGGWVTTFIKPPQDTFGRCNEPGQCTDDFIQGKYILDEALKNKGELNEEVMKSAFRRWLDYPYYLNFTGPTTRSAMQRLFNDNRMSLQGGVSPVVSEKSISLINDGNASATNGAAMKIWVAVLLSLNNPRALLENVYRVSCLTHNNVLSVSGASAIAFAIMQALNAEASIESIFSQAIAGAHQGYLYAYQRGAMMMAGASVTERIKLAIQIGKQYTGWQDALIPLADVIGSGLQANEAVPVVFGLLASCRNNPLDAIHGGVNIGNDTDTVATMAGAIAGAFCGIQSFNDADVDVLQKANSIDFRQISNNLLHLYST